MQIPPLPPDEKERLKELYSYQILNTPQEEAFDEIVELASSICNAPMSTITLIDIDRQWFKSRVGMNGQAGSRQISFCAHAILQDDLFVVPDASRDERFYDNPLVTEKPDIRFYAGMPLVTQNGFKVGTLCVMDHQPRALTENQLLALKVLSRQVIRLMELRLRNLELERTNDRQNKMLSLIAHDVRTPLGGIQSIIELFEDGILSSQELKAMMQEVDLRLKGTLDLLNNLVDWGMSQLRQKGIRKTTFSPARVGDEIIFFFKAHAESKGNRFINEVPSDVQMLADENRFKIVLRNLINNANKFTSQGTIVLSYEERDTHHIIKVSDTGIGMSATTQDNLFNWFSRISTRGTHNEIGSGLGLVICKEFVQELEGALSVKSKEGEGTVFTFSVKK